MENKADANHVAEARIRGIEAGPGPGDIQGPADVCKKFGHKVEQTDSQHCPESGSEHFVCARCGEHWDITYY